MAATMTGTIPDSAAGAPDDSPEPEECLRCYLTRMVTAHDCDNTRKWTINWRDLHAPADRRLLRRIEDRGGICCDCEVLFNVWPEDPEPDRPFSCSGRVDIDPLIPCGAWPDWPGADEDADW
jgi:Protein of unknown function (DUF2695)